MPSRSLFVAGTDTGVGKTRVACALIAAARAQGIDAVGFKPIASGAQRTPQGLRNDDALALLRASGNQDDYGAINPLVFEPPIAPHLAAAEAGVVIDPTALDRAHAQLAQRHSHIVVEGAGGWLVPLNERQTFADWVGDRQWPVVLVVAMRLGCLNHALLSIESIARRTHLAGWIANVIPPQQPQWQANIDTLRQRIDAPLWGTVGLDADESAAAAALDSAPLRAWLRGSS